MTCSSLLSKPRFDSTTKTHIAASGAVILHASIHVSTWHRSAMLLLVLSIFNSHNPSQVTLRNQMQSPDPLTRNSFFPGRLGRRLRPLSLLPSVPGASRKTAPPARIGLAARRTGRCGELRALPAPPASPGHPRHRARGSRPGPASRTPLLGSWAVPRLRGPPATHTQHRHTHRHALPAGEGGPRPKKVDPSVAGAWKRRGGLLPARTGTSPPLPRPTRPYGWSAGRLVAERPLQSLRSLREVWWKPRIKNKGKPTLFASFASQC